MAGVGKIRAGRILHYALCTLHSAFRSLPARAISIKNKHLLVIYSIPTRGFTAAVSVFRGTPPPKPLNCKSVLNHRGALIGNLWANSTGEEFCILCACFNLARSDIIKTSLVFRSQQLTFRCYSQLPSFSFGETKTPAYTG